ncbi:uncharacterized protein KY384_009209 [Bacidia gigantensis]|uniref:uncharacterized protein n=1 Tax=Bacidia gigantensis TaxID=2732470 RepID=UPI001D04265B|nr:uncharacterized protein KY384_009209 [Bacidia gigantensis]KAG8525565.1 hypothetical protein KY384_009209 [Bacidia gigantensis]
MKEGKMMEGAVGIEAEQEALIGEKNVTTAIGTVLESDTETAMHTDHLTKTAQGSVGGLETET